MPPAEAGVEPERHSRYDTTLEAAGAEHLVIGHLLIDRIQAFRAHANQPGYDLLAVAPATRSSLKIQVKSRVAVDSGMFKLDSFDFDFVVFVRLNRGTKESLRLGRRDGARPPEFYVVPRRQIESWFGKPPARIGVPRIQSFRERWELLHEELNSHPLADFPEWHLTT